MNMKIIASTLLIATASMCFGKGLYIVAGGDFRNPQATAKVSVTNTTEPFVFAPHFYASKPFSIKINKFEETNFANNTYTNLMLSSSEVGIRNIRIYDPYEKIWFCNFFQNRNIIEFNFPPYCNNNGQWSSIFANSTVQSVTLPTNITYIGNSLFQNCSNLTHVTLPATIVSIGHYAFMRSALPEITIPNGVKTIGMAAFSWSALTSVTMPDSVETIGKNCFEACLDSLHKINGNSLTYVKLSNSITNIPQLCFNSSQRLNTVIMPANLKRIEKQAFIACSDINNLVFSPAIEFIGDEAFKSCSSFNTIYFTGTLDEYKANATLVAAFGSVPETEPANNTILLNKDGTYNNTWPNLQKTLHFNYTYNR